MSTDVRRYRLAICPCGHVEGEMPRAGCCEQCGRATVAESVPVTADDDVQAAIAAERRAITRSYGRLGGRSRLGVLDRVEARLGLEGDIERTGSRGATDA